METLLKTAGALVSNDNLDTEIKRLIEWNARKLETHNERLEKEVERLKDDMSRALTDLTRNNHMNSSGIVQNQGAQIDMLVAVRAEKIEALQSLVHMAELILKAK